MRKTTYKFIYLLIITAFMSSVSYIQAQNPYRVRDSQVQYLLNRIETRTDAYKRNLDRALDSNSRLDGTDTEDMILGYISDFENATDTLKQKFADKNSVDADVEDVLQRGAFINQFMTRNRLNTTVQSSWRYLRTDLTTLASYYSVAFDFNKVPTQTTAGNTTRVSDSEVQTLLTRIEANTDTFKRRLNNGLDRSTLNNSNAEDSIANFITDFENSTDQLKQRFDARRAVARDVEDVLMKANFIDGFLNDYRMNRRVQADWDVIKKDLNTLAGYYNVSFKFGMPTNTGGGNTTVGGLPYTTNDRTLSSLLTGLESKTDLYKRSMNTALDGSVLNNTRSEDTIQSYITEFENSTDALKQNFDARRSTKADVENVLTRAYYIDSFMRDYRFTTTAERDWSLIRRDLDTLSNYYNVSWNWNRRFEPASQFDSMLSGTYRLNVRDSDVVSEVVERATQYYTANQRENIRTRLERRLMSPEMIAIEKRANAVTIASSNQPQVTFEADGTARTETVNRRAIKVTGNTSYDGVSLNYEGDRINDFYVNFMPVNNGRQLRVIRRIYLESRNDTITVASVYDKTDETARFNDLTPGGGVVGDFVIANNTKITAVLQDTISTKASQDGDKFTMEVTSPSQFDGAVITGRIIKAEKSGRVSGRANLSLDFETIRLRNGQTYRFAGIIDSVKSANGDDVKVNNEGTVRDGNQTTKTVTRAGIGAGIGALIGAIIGGGEGAAIGAAVGAGAGAGTVFIEGRDNIELTNGSEFMLTATAPNNVR